MENLIRSVNLPTTADLIAAREVVSRWLAPTPLLSTWIQERRVHLKLETLQPTGSFKVRGAIAAVSHVRPGHRIIAVSAGNHALGIAWASSQLGVPATVVLAKTASPAKLAALHNFPIEVITHGDTYDAAESFALKLAAESPEDTIFVSAYNDPRVIAGQSTVLDEISEATGDQPLTVVVPTGGGGLLAGISMRAAELSTLSRPIVVVGVESAASLAVSASVRAGRTVEVLVGETVADGLSGNLEPDSVTVAVIRQHAPRMVSVTEEEIHAAMRYLTSSVGVVAEGAGAAATAAIAAGKAPAAAGVTVAIVSGRNIALPRLAHILAG